MKIFVVAAAFVALCSGNALPTVPGDNSHYVEGESRYIWMPDGEGTPVLVDLQEPVDEAVLNSRNGANNAYWLFTRRNPNNAQVIVNGNANSVRNSNYNGARALKVIVHGWNNNGNTAMNPLITSAFLAVQDLCSGNALPTVPGDNSHYVEGESRYIWMPDSEGTPVLVDLQEPVDEAVLNSRNGANNAYWLFTR
ncbi:hypothetical protein PYW07_007039 [Mythimna separata]|uniref:Lipase domain-containing protein n=1 Tax=Mythimna separata TaxID=271217 RepID=A0AAD7Z2Q5_MYTSE|nr:hypothetical protein PYW07_007039 [Mythimna separata]